MRDVKYISRMAVAIVEFHEILSKILEDAQEDDSLSDDDFCFLESVVDHVFLL